MEVRPADADLADGDQHLVGAGFGSWALLDFGTARLFQNCRSHGEEFGVER